LRFRLGCHHQRVHTGHWCHPPLPRSHRRCLRCPGGGLTPLDDEAHCLLFCAHPDIVESRDTLLASLAPASWAALRTYSGFWSLASTGHLPHRAVVKVVALCVRVGWSCHRAGGSDVVEFPEVVLDPDQYLDMFDSDSDFSGDLSSSSSLSWLKCHSGLPVGLFCILSTYWLDQEVVWPVVPGSALDDGIRKYF